MSYSVTLNTGGPRDPAYVLEVAEAHAEAVRVLNHLTRDHGALEYPGEADKLIRELSSAASRLPQLLGQVGLWLAEEAVAGRVRVPSGDWQDQAASAVAAARVRLDAASARAEALQEALDYAASVTSGLGAVETEEDDGDG